MKNKLDEQKEEINSVENKEANENKSISGDKVVKEETEESEYCEDTSPQEKSKELVGEKTLKDISNIKKNDDDEKMNNDIKNAQKTDKGKENPKFNIIIGAIIVLIFSLIIFNIFLKSTPISSETKQTDKSNQPENEGIDIPDYSNDEEENYLSIKKPIIGIDFGSYQSGYAIMENNILIDYDKNKNIEPTVILLHKKNRKGYKFGKDANDAMTNSISDEYIFFDRIKLNLDPKLIDPKEQEILIESEYPKNYKIPLKIVIIEFLKLFSDKIMADFGLIGTYYSNFRKKIYNG